MFDKQVIGRETAARQDIIDVLKADDINYIRFNRRREFLLSPLNYQKVTIIAQQDTHRCDLHAIVTELDYHWYLLFVVRQAEQVRENMFRFVRQSHGVLGQSKACERDEISQFGG